MCSNRDTVTQFRPADTAPRHATPRRRPRQARRATLYCHPAPPSAVHRSRPRTYRGGHARRDTAGVRAARAASRGRRTPGLVAPACAARRCLPSVPPRSKSESYTYLTPEPLLPLAPTGAPWPHDSTVHHRTMGAAAAGPPLHARPSPAIRAEPLPGLPRC
jgi:hypothetical protein